MQLVADLASVHHSHARLHLGQPVTRLAEVRLCHWPVALRMAKLDNLGLLRSDLHRHELLQRECSDARARAQREARQAPRERKMDVKEKLTAVAWFGAPGIFHRLNVRSWWRLHLRADFDHFRRQPTRQFCDPAVLDHLLLGRLNVHVYDLWKAEHRLYALGRYVHRTWSHFGSFRHEPDH